VNNAKEWKTISERDGVTRRSKFRTNHVCSCIIQKRFNFRESCLFMYHPEVFQLCIHLAFKQGHSWLALDLTGCIVNLATGDEDDLLNDYLFLPRRLSAILTLE
jgi:hypothetical protein